jgi:hypothetical protein
LVQVRPESEGERSEHDGDDESGKFQVAETSGNRVT